MRDRNLDGFDVQLLGEIDGLAQGLAGFAGQADDEVAVDQPGRASWQFAVKRSAMSTVAPFLMFFRICGSPDS